MVAPPISEKAAQLLGIALLASPRNPRGCLMVTQQW
jgi:hypothetical protein